MNRVLELRKEKKLKQQELADIVRVSRQAVSKWELGQIDLNTENIQRLCEIFHVTADYLLGFSEIRSPEITEGEMLLVEAYRAADPRAKAVVDLTLEPWLGGVRRAEGE